MEEAAAPAPLPSFRGRRYREASVAAPAPDADDSWNLPKAPSEPPLADSNRYSSRLNRARSSNLRLGRSTSAAKLELQAENSNNAANDVEDVNDNEVESFDCSFNPGAASMMPSGQLLRVGGGRAAASARSAATMAAMEAEIDRADCREMVRASVRALC